MSTRVPVLDTTEVRWFAAGSAPREVLGWFDEVGPASVFEERSDLYRMDGLVDVGVKRRFGELLELKVRRSVDRHLALPKGPSGRPEHWRKWSPADGLVGTHRESRRLAVRKTIARKAIPIGQSVSLAGE